MALGAADAVERLGLEFSNIVGIDGTPQGVEAVDQGRLLGTVVMDYPAHGEAIFRLSRALALGDDPQETAGLSERIIRIPMYIYS